MFSTETPPQSRRKSFHAFTRQLVNPLQRVHQQHHSHSQPTPSMSHPNHPQHQNSNNTNNTNTNTTTNTTTNTSASAATQQLPPSASLILGQTAKINPRLPRPSSAAITQSAVPTSYAYGAAGSPPQPGLKQAAASVQTVDTTDSISPRSRSSRGRHTAALFPDDMSLASVSSEKNGPEPAQIRYARLNQRLQNTGSANAPSQALPKVIVPKPSSTHLNDTSVNIASAFERAQIASRSKQMKNNNPDPLNHQQQNNHHTRPENPHSSHNRESLADSNDQYTNTDQNENQATNKKRKKSRRSIDPSYKYRPGDSATSDSEAGEGIADKRLRREKKARLEQEKNLAQSGTAKKRATSSRRRTSSRRSNGSDDLTDSDEDTGPGIAATRGRRIPKENQAESAPARATSNRRNEGPSRKKAAPSNNQRNDGRSDLNQDDGTEPGGFIRTNRTSAQRIDPNAAPHTTSNKTQPSATFFLSDPEASQPPEMEDARHQTHDQDFTAGTTESSRSVLRLSGDSYDFAEEERIVKALGDQTRQQRPPAAENSIGDGSTSEPLRQESSSNSGWAAGSSRDRMRSDEAARRSDSGLHEIEEAVASSRQAAHPKPDKPRVLPLPIPHHQVRPISPTPRDIPEPELRKQPKTSPLTLIQGLGMRCGKQLASLLSHLFRADFWNRFVWLVLLGSVASALLINSYKTGDITFPSLPFFWSSKRTLPTFSAPKTEIHDLAELIERLKSLESVVSTISVEQRQDSKNLQQSLVRDKKELDYKVGRLELKLEEEEKVRAGLEDKVHRKVDQSVKGLRSDLESVIIGHRHDHAQLEKTKDTIEELGGRLESLDNSNSNSVTREEARVMIEQVWSVKGRDGLGDSDKLKQAVLKATMKQIGQEGYVTKTEIGQLLESELRVMGAGFEKQLDSKLDKIRQELQAAPRSRLRNLEGAGSGAGLESVQSLIDEAIERYSQDEIGKRDFALYSGGARVIPQLTSETYAVRFGTWSQTLIGFFIGAETSAIRGRGPTTALSAEVELGKCWPIAGSTGQLAVYLSRKILITEVSVEHVSKSLAYELDSSPREIEVWSIDDSQKLLELVYDPNLPSRVQTFPVPSQLNYRPAPSDSDDNQSLSSSQQDLSSPSPAHHSSSPTTPILRQGVLFKIKSNHGNPEYTCLYRVRVHGLMESELPSQ